MKIISNVRGIVSSLLFCVLLLLVLAACSQSSRPDRAMLPERITVQGNRFVDDQGRQVILNGINVVSKSKEEQYLFQAGPEFYTRLKQWGVNCIRFIIIWDGLEPTPGSYNEEYLQEIDKRIRWAGENDLFVVLDMHQDLFSVKYSDGAPEWATLDEGKPHVTGAVWSDAYMLSPAVQTSFDNFWTNQPAEDGIGVQDHYVALWKHIAARYADNPTVIGYDIMNEPFPGSSAAQAMPALLGAYGQLVYSLTGERLSEEELSEAWGSEQNRAEVLKTLSSRENFRQVMDALYPFNRQFETTYLQPMYQRVANAIRTVDSSHILFLEHSYFSNTGVESSIERTLLPDGSPDPQVAYAPHGYDLVTDTEAAAQAATERLAFIFGRILEKGNQLNMPVWLGEWGAYYSHGEEIVPVARRTVGLIEKNLFGQAYWSYDPGTEKQPYFQQALLRPFPAYTNGRLLQYQNDFNNSTLRIEWEEDPNNPSPTVVYIPRMSRLNKELLQEQAAVSYRPMEDSDAGWVLVPPESGTEARKLTFQFAN